MNMDSTSNPVMDNYLKRHNLDFKLLPNKKLIKLSDLTAIKNSFADSLVRDCNNNNQNNSFDNLSQLNSDSTSLKNVTSSSCHYVHINENQVEKDEENMLLETDLDSKIELKENSNIEEHNEELDEPSLLKSIQLTESALLTSSNNEVSQETIDDMNNVKQRKKREPSLKLKQKLNLNDLELLVSAVRDKKASVFIADIQKEHFKDKILRVKLSDDIDENRIQLSNGTKEAFLKKSMFPRELNSLFDTFVNSLCGQEVIIDNNGIRKPTLKCLVVDCEFKSFSEAEILRHIKRHLAQDGYTCSQCSHQFASMTNLQRHLRIHEGSVDKEAKCPHCDYKAATITHVKRHMAHKHLERSLPCPHCSFMGATNADLKIHMARKHLELTGKNPLFLPKYLRKDYMCSICKEQFNDFKEYQTHMYEHTSQSNRFQCTECAYNCKNFSKLKRHMLYHTGARNFECKMCGNKFFQMEHLKRHMQSIHNIILQSEAQTNGKTTKKLSFYKHNPSNEFLKQCSINTTNENSTAESTGNSSTEENTQDHLVSSSNLSNQNTESQSSCKINVKCLYKCNQCQFETASLLLLNQHVRNVHQLANSQIEIEIFKEEEEQDETEDEENNQNEIGEEFNATLSEVQDFSLNNFIFNCSFCSYKSSKKAFLKKHLEKVHSSEYATPIYLNNEEALHQPNTRLQCSICQNHFNAIQEYMDHMKELHKVLVFLVDSKSQNVNEQQVPTEEPIDSMQMPYKNNCEQSPNLDLNETRKQLSKSKPVQQPTSKKVKSNVKQATLQGNNLSEHQQIRNFINTSSHLSRALAQHSTKVRINPLLLKLNNTPSAPNQNKSLTINNNIDNIGLASNFMINQIPIYDEPANVTSYRSIEQPVNVNLTDVIYQ